MRHAYLIIAHEKPEIVNELIMAIDDERNDIYVHIDAKATFDGSEFTTYRSNLYVLPRRIDAAWGDFSLVEIELALVKAALDSGNYQYLHLISGVDLPVKTQDEIHAECDRLDGTQFIGFAQNVTERELKWRTQHYFLFPRHFKNTPLTRRIIMGSLARIQSAIGYKRCRLEIKKGSQWWSITQDFARYVINLEDYIKKHFTHTYCPDEIVFQTMCWNSPYRKSIYNKTDEFISCKRYIPWNNNAILDFTADDFNKMQAKPWWFARKFSFKDLDSWKKLISL